MEIVLIDLNARDILGLVILAAGILYVAIDGIKTFHGGKS